ncbi:MAG TPA: hypothetical protein VNT76_23830, partial [Candidatus Binatus sp.]|nr:hypothetical protein [Candidatus Binatus sp.]
MMRRSVATFAILGSFAAGFCTHLLYQRWNPAAPETMVSGADIQQTLLPGGGAGQSFRVSFVPLSPAMAPGEIT